MKLTLFDQSEDICKALESRFKGVENVTVNHCMLHDLEPHTALVTAGNSYCIMTGGIDLAVRDLLGFETQDTLQNAILYRGIIPVGGCSIVETGSDKFKYLIYAPTMERPTIISPFNVYQAAYTAFYHAFCQDFDTVACCALGTGVGRVPAVNAAEEMYQAYNNIKNRF